MPASGPVYQPTTVSYEQQSEWSQPTNGLINRTLNHIRNPRWFHWSFILISWILIAIGVFLFLSITTTFVRSEDKKDNYTEDIAFLVIGSFCFVFGVVLLIGYFRYIKDKESCPCFTGKARQMESQSSNGQVCIDFKKKKKNYYLLLMCNFIVSGTYAKPVYRFVDDVCTVRTDIRSPTDYYRRGRNQKTNGKR